MRDTIKQWIESRIDAGETDMEMVWYECREAFPFQVVSWGYVRKLFRDKKKGSTCATSSSG